MDSRFDTSAWEKEDLAEQQESAGSEEVSDASNEDADAGPSRSPLLSADENDTLDDVATSGEAKVVKPLSKEELSEYEKKHKKRGIVYISRIPPGMTPAKVRHLLSRFGDIERVYLQADGGSKQSTSKSKKSSKHTPARFTEGWAEFADKRVGRVAAEMLNARPIGSAGGGSGKRGKRWKDDVWTMKYLPGFKWGMLSEQIANERASHAARLRTELSQSAFEQKDYLKKVERARVMSDKAAKRAARAAASGTTQNADASPASGAEIGPGGKERTFRQREPVLRDVRDQRAAAEARDTGAQKRAADERAEDAEGKSRKKARKSEKARQVRPADDGSVLEGVLGKVF